MSKDDNSIFYVYVLFDWLGVPRYVGKGKGGRWLDHEKNTDPTNWRKNEFIEQTWIMFGEIPKIKVREDISEEDALNTEVTLIEIIGRLNHGTGPLTNITDGGDGFSSKQMLAFHAGRTPEERRNIALKGVASMTTEQRKARYLKMRSKLTPEQILNIGRNLTRNMTSEQRRIISSLGGKAHTIEQLREIGKKVVKL